MKSHERGCPSLDNLQLNARRTAANMASDAGGCGK